MPALHARSQSSVARRSSRGTPLPCASALAGTAHASASPSLQAAARRSTCLARLGGTPAPAACIRAALTHEAGSLSSHARSCRWTARVRSRAVPSPRSARAAMTVQANAIPRSQSSAQGATSFASWTQTRGPPPSSATDDAGSPAADVASVLALRLPGVLGVHAPAAAPPRRATWRSARVRTPLAYVILRRASFVTASREPRAPALAAGVIRHGPPLCRGDRPPQDRRASSG